jgi:hypothetical protein
MMVTDVGVKIGVRAGKGILCTIAAVRHQRNQVVATLLKRHVLLRKCTFGDVIEIKCLSALGVRKIPNLEATPEGI